MTKTYSQMHRTDKYSEQSSIIWPVWPNGWVFVYELSGSGFESSCSHLTFRFRACFEQGVPWHSGNNRVWIHSETCTWHDKNIQTVSILYSELAPPTCDVTCSKVQRYGDSIGDKKLSVEQALWHHLIVKWKGEIYPLLADVIEIA